MSEEENKKSKADKILEELEKTNKKLDVQGATIAKLEEDNEILKKKLNEKEESAEDEDEDDELY